MTPISSRFFSKTPPPHSSTHGPERGLPALERKTKAVAEVSMELLLLEEEERLRKAAEDPPERGLPTLHARSHTETPSCRSPEGETKREKPLPGILSSRELMGTSLPRPPTPGGGRKMVRVSSFADGGREEEGSVSESRERSVLHRAPTPDARALLRRSPAPEREGSSSVQQRRKHVGEEEALRKSPVLAWGGRDSEPPRVGVRGLVALRRSPVPPTEEEKRLHHSLVETRRETPLLRSPVPHVDRRTVLPLSAVDLHEETALSRTPAPPTEETVALHLSAVDVRRAIAVRRPFVPRAGAAVLHHSLSDARSGGALPRSPTPPKEEEALHQSIIDARRMGTLHRSGAPLPAERRLGYQSLAELRKETGLRRVARARAPEEEERKVVSPPIPEEEAGFQHSLVARAGSILPDDFAALGAREEDSVRGSPVPEEEK